MQATIKGDKLILELDLNDNPPFSSSGKTRVVATTNGFMPTTVQVNGKAVSVSVNATIKP